MNIWGEFAVKKVMLGVAILLVLIVTVFGIGMIVGYNKLVEQDETISAAQSQIEIRLQQRHDTLGSMIAAVNGLQAHAETIYNMITAAREAYANAKSSGNIEDMIEADAGEASALASLIAEVEDNPLISATSAYQDLLDSIYSLESSLAVARRDYNSAVLEYNTSVRKFPRVLYAGIFGFEKNMPYWKMNEGADEIPQIVVSTVE